MECSISGVVMDAKGEGRYHLPPLLTEYATSTKKSLYPMFLSPSSNLYKCISFKTLQM